MPGGVSLSLSLGIPRALNDWDSEAALRQSPGAGVNDRWPLGPWPGSPARVVRVGRVSRQLPAEEGFASSAGLPGA